MRLTTPARLADFVRRHYGPQIAGHAAYHLRERRPDLSAGTLGGARMLLALGAIGVGIACLGSATLPGAVQVVAMALASAVLLGWTLLRGCACLLPPRPRAPVLADDARLPHYSLIIPLYREARVVPKLAAALRRLDYPPEKLQVLLAVEEDDAETLDAVRRHAAGVPFELVPVPAVGPRTKPKALNIALAYAQGPLVAVYDAEDEPEPDQLRAAALAFARDTKGRLGCVQARLAIDNARDSWLARQFAAEYAGQFDVLLPMLAVLRLPFPLGGTSNHFRLAALEAAGGWDPFNVTEDADLGVRLARLGWRSDVIASTTQEEAPARFPAWLRQRTRWYKGWLQTVLVHARTPARTIDQLGPRAAAALALLIGGGLATALIHPFFAAMLAMRLTGLAQAPASLLAGVIEGIGLATLAAGYGATALFTAIGMGRRGVPGVVPAVLLIPLYWLLLSVAAWRALCQLLYAPYRWEKTEHGLALTSLRRARSRRRDEPDLASRPITDSAADRPPPLRAAA